MHAFLTLVLSIGVLLFAVAPAVAQNDGPRVYLTVRPTQVLYTGSASGFIPADLSLTIHVPVKLTFRTDKAIVQL